MGMPKTGGEIHHEQAGKSSGYYGVGVLVGLQGMGAEGQREVIEKFRQGTVRVMVCTMVGEEGLDIGEVDMVIGYDGGLTPVRMVQRMGRTGRGRKGRVVLLLTEGEERMYRAAVDRHREIMERLADGGEGTLHLYPFSGRMVKGIPRIEYSGQGGGDEGGEEKDDGVEGILETVRRGGVDTGIDDKGEGNEHMDMMDTMDDKDSKDIRECIQTIARSSSVCKERTEESTKETVGSECMQSVDMDSLDREIMEVLERGEKRLTGID